MRILLRKYNEKYYVWLDAQWRDHNYYISDVDGFEYEVDQDLILAVENDPRIGYVICNNCGKLIKNDPESIEAHYVETESQKNCLRCMHLSTSRDKEIIDATCTKNEDGTYNVTQTFVANLLCHYGYWRQDIESQEAINNCVYRKCRRDGVSQIDDVFVKYPGLFEKFLTVDALIAKKCEKGEFKNGFFEYDLKCRGTVKACVNEMGIVDHFKLSYRGSTYRFCYSDKYGLLIEKRYNRYYDNINSNVSDRKLEEIKKKIADLYKEVTK